MNISQDTISVLKNFSTINLSLIIREGNKLKTISPGKDIFSECTVAEEFPQEFGIYDLSKFLAAISMFKDPTFDFKDTHVVISSKGSRSNLKYYFSDAKQLFDNNKTMNMPSSVVSFRLEAKDLLELQKASAVLACPDIEIVRNDNRLLLRVLDRKDSTGNTYSIDVGECDTDADFRFLFKVETLRLLPGTYDVRISDKLVSEFRSEDGNRVYWISVEADSTYKAGKKKAYAAIS